MIYTPKDLKWIKNVTDKVKGSAYMDVDEIFRLEHPAEHRNKVLNPRVNEIIVLFQRINNGPHVFTHLVTPVDGKLLTNASNVGYPYSRRVRVIAKTEIGNVIQRSQTLLADSKFSGISQGQACEISKISTIDNLVNIQIDLWNKFLPYLSVFEPDSCDNYLGKQIEDDLGGGEETVEEGRQRLVIHMAKERDRSIINRKKEEARRDDKFWCEVCEFSFIQTYDVDFIECHHIVPISEGELRQTGLDDLALVCPNCHRMLHKKIDGAYLSMDQLKDRRNRI